MNIITEKAEVLESVREGGVEVARLRLSKVKFDGKYRKINDFYERICENAIAFFRGQYASAAREEYLSSDDGKKEYRFRRFEYTIDFDVKYSDDDYLSVLTVCRSVRRGSTEDKKQSVASQCWRLRDQKLMPLMNFVPKRKTRRKLLPGGQRAAGFYLDGGAPICFDSAGNILSADFEPTPAQ